MGERDKMLVAESYFSEKKLKNDFGAAFRYLYTHLFFRHCHVTFPYMSVFSILGNRLCNSKICGFQIHFVTSYRKIQMAAIMLQTILTFYAKISE